MSSEQSNGHVKLSEAVGIQSNGHGAVQGENVGCLELIPDLSRSREPVSDVGLSVNGQMFDTHYDIVAGSHRLSRSLELDYSNSSSPVMSPIENLKCDHEDLCISSTLDEVDGTCPGPHTGSPRIRPWGSSRISRSGMGNVYESEHLETGRKSIDFTINDTGYDDPEMGPLPLSSSQTQATATSWSPPNGITYHSNSYYEQSSSTPTTLSASTPKKSSSMNMMNLFRSTKIPKDSVSSSTVDETDEHGDTLKSKFMSAWNNVRHGWTVRMKTNFKVDTPIWVLGCLYHYSLHDSEYHPSAWMTNTQKELVPSLEEFKRDFTSRIWFTYRKDFPALPGSTLTSDVGWGCMVRAGQMMLAQALVVHFLSRDWRWYPQQKKQDVLYHRQIIKYFCDAPSEESPFSIHRLVEIGMESGKMPGDWYGPASVAHVLKTAIEQAPKFYPSLGQLCLYVAQDCTVYKQDVIELCTEPPPFTRRHSMRHSCSNPSFPAELADEPHVVDPPWRAVVILVPVRLGGEVLNPIYIPCVQTVLAHNMCIGIIGGKPKHSVYFVGWQDDKLIHMDPHFCQETADVKQKNYPIHTFHCMSPRKMAFTKMDPSCTIGFYCKTRGDFERFCLEVSQMVAPPKEKGLYPMFIFSEGRSSDVSYEESEKEKRQTRTKNSARNSRQFSKESEDFVFL